MKREKIERERKQSWVRERKMKLMGSKCCTKNSRKER